MFDAQPYRAPPRLKVPPCESGCARVQKFGCDRVSHGTGAGAGCTSNSGFWIPTKDPPASEVLAAAAAAAAASGGGGGPRRPGRKAKRGGGGGGGGGSGRPPTGRSWAAAVKPLVFNPDEPPPAPVELLPLPEGVPERLAITCNGREAVFVVRAQRVEVEGVEMAPSKFEQMCGRGDAKKWKSSLYVRLEDGRQGSNMGVSGLCSWWFRISGLWWFLGLVEGESYLRVGLR